ncbi:MAG: HIT domain-containing protein [Acidobacteriota bacterium]|jgi:ATP adenylyltransferase|nr:HIT domain-containing protein [Acidobacteriota bacterium]NLT32078.1 HIT domain-containing protein [Acidobacteriota bacterium]
MDRLWTPWRFDYIRGADAASSCVFCPIFENAEHDPDHFVLHRGRSAFVLLNLFPYSSGHLLVVANRHIRLLEDARPEELHEMIDLARRCEHALRLEYAPDGFNIGLNLGRSAGAGVEHHLHMHVVPRWTGDANFISIVGETRVLPEELPRTYERLLPHFRSL